MNRKVFQIFKITTGFFKQHKNQQIRYHYSKLEHFLENYQHIEHKQLKISQNNLDTLLFDMNYQSSYQFNVSLTTYLKQSKISQNELLTLLQGLYQNNTFISKFNKQILNQSIIRELKELNDGTVQLITMSGLIGLGDDELTEESIYQLLKSNIQQFTFYQKISLVFVFGQQSLKHDVLEQNQEFIEKWQILLDSCKKDIKQSQYVEGYQLSQIAFLIKGIVQTDQDLIIQTNKKIKDDVKQIFSLLMEKFSKNLDFKQMTIKELTVLLISITKTKNQLQNIKFDQLIKSLLEYVKFIGLNDCSEVALQSLIYSLTTLPNWQRAFSDDILNNIQNRLLNKDYKTKMMMIILSEIYFKWQHQSSRQYLENLMQLFDVKEFSELDICNYFQLLSLLPQNAIQKILDQAEQDLINRQKITQEISELNRKDANILDRQRRALQKICQQLYSDTQQNQTLDRISKMFY